MGHPEISCFNLITSFRYLYRSLFFILIFKIYFWLEGLMCIRFWSVGGNPEIMKQQNREME